MQAASSIYIREDLKTQLNNLKRNPKESYNDVIERLVNLTIDDEPLSAGAIKGLEEGLRDIKKGNLISEEDIRKKYGVE
jgi:predicted CopG family antitoxin